MFRVGTPVVVHGLVSCPELNGKDGQIQGYTENDRWVVNVFNEDGTSSRKALRATNIRYQGIGEVAARAPCDVFILGCVQTELRLGSEGLSAGASREFYAPRLRLLSS